MVRARRAEGEHLARAGRAGRGEEELELADLVARVVAGAQVVALDPQLTAADLAFETTESLDGRGAVDERDVREPCGERGMCAEEMRCRGAGMHAAH